MPDRLDEYAVAKSMHAQSNLQPERGADPYTQYDVDDWYYRIDCVRAGAKRTLSPKTSWVCLLKQWSKCGSRSR